MAEWTPFPTNSTESEYSARQTANRAPFIGNGEAVGAGASTQILSGIAVNERCFITTIWLSCINTSAAAAGAGSICVTDTAGTQILVLAKMNLQQATASEEASNTQSLSFPMPIKVEAGREVRVITSAGGTVTATACVTGWIETF